MRAVTLSNTAVDLLAQNIPIGSTAVVNAGNGIVIQYSQDNSNWTTLATLTTASPWQTVTLLGRYIRVSTSAPGTLLYN